MIREYDPFEFVDMVPGGRHRVDRVCGLWAVVQQCAADIEHLLRKEHAHQNACPLFPQEPTLTSRENGIVFLRGLTAGANSESLQELATEPAVHPYVRRMAAHYARVALNWFLVVAQRVTENAPAPFRAVSAGPLAVVWVACGRVRWEVNQFELVEHRGELDFVEGLPVHLDTPSKREKWTEQQSHHIGPTGGWSARELSHA